MLVAALSMRLRERAGSPHRSRYDYYEVQYPLKRLSGGDQGLSGFMPIEASSRLLI